MPDGSSDYRPDSRCSYKIYCSMNRTIQDSNPIHSLICRQCVALVDEITFSNCVLTWFNMILGPFSFSMKERQMENKGLQDYVAF